MASDDIFVLGAANLQSRKTKAGKERYRINVRGDSILVNTDPKSLGRAPAEAIRDVLRERIASIATSAPAATIKAREVAARAFAAGKQWALKRYGGGRIGAMPPNQNTTAFGDSGRFAQSIAVGATSDGYTINVAANRLDSTTSGGVERIWDRLRELVPELADPRRLMDSIPVRRAVREATAAAIQVANERTIALKRQLLQARIDVVRNLIGLAI